MFSQPDLNTQKILKLQLHGNPLPCAKQLVDTQLHPGTLTSWITDYSCCAGHKSETVMCTVPAECRGRSLSACRHTSPWQPQGSGLRGQSHQRGGKPSVQRSQSWVQVRGPCHRGHSWPVTKSTHLRLGRRLFRYMCSLILILLDSLFP